jgi:hypothetical protein
MSNFSRSRYLKRAKAYIASLLENKKEETVKVSSQSKVVKCYSGDKLVAEYTSITKCATAFGMSRLMIRKAIENGVVLENGLQLKF